MLDYFCPNGFLFFFILLFDKSKGIKQLNHTFSI